MDPPSAGAKWGLAAVLGCGACCGGLAGTLAWAGATAVVAPVAAGAVVVAGASVAGVSWLRRRRAAQEGEDDADAHPETSR